MRLILIFIIMRLILIFIIIIILRYLRNFKKVYKEKRKEKAKTNQIFFRASKDMINTYIQKLIFHAKTFQFLSF